MTKVKVGDIFEIATSNGVAFFQCVFTDKIEGELIKVFNKTFTNGIDNIEILSSISDTYFIGFPLNAALNKKIVTQIGFLQVSSKFVKPRFRRSKNGFGKNPKGWFIVDTYTDNRIYVEDLDEEQIKLSPNGIINDTLLIKRLDEGWNLEKWI